MLMVMFLLVGWLVVLRIYVALAVFRPYRDFDAGDNQSLKFKLRDRESNPGPHAPQAKRSTTRPPPHFFVYSRVTYHEYITKKIPFLYKYC